MCSWFAGDELIVLFDDANIFHGALNNGREGGSEIRGGTLKVLGSGRVSTGEDLASIVERHFLQGIEEDLFCLRRGLFGSAVHADLSSFTVAPMPNMRIPLPIV